MSEYRSRLNKIPKVPCPKCDGSGMVEIPEYLLGTYHIVKKLGRATSFDIHKDTDFKDAIGATGICNRLTDLLALGVLSRVRNGKAWSYSVRKI